MVARAEFEGALRYDEQLLPATAVAIASGKESVVVAIPGTPEVPAADPDREVIWTVDGSTVRFDLSALRAKPAVTVTTTTVLDSTNSVVFSVGSTLCMLARTAASETAASQFLFSADRADTYSVELAVSSIDLEPWARRSNATKVAAANLPSPWLTQAQVDARVRKLTGLQILHAGRAVGMRIRNTNSMSTGSFRALAPAFDLDEHRTGELHVVMTVTFDDRSVLVAGFGTNEDRTYTFDGVVLASDVSALGTYVSSGPFHGEPVGSSVYLHDSFNQLGLLSFYFAKNANNELGYLLRYSGGGTSGSDVTLTATMEVSFSRTDAPAATSSTGHVGPLIAKLDIPAGTLAANARPAAAWVVQSGAPRDFEATGGSNGQLNVPRVLPDNMAGVVVRTKVGTTNTVSQVFLPWVPIHEDVAWDTRIGPSPFGTNVFHLLVSDDSTARTVKLVLQREWASTTKDRLEVVGNAEQIKAGTTIELLQWV